MNKRDVREMRLKESDLKLTADVVQQVRAASLRFQVSGYADLSRTATRWYHDRLRCRQQAHQVRRSLGSRVPFHWGSQRSPLHPSLALAQHGILQDLRQHLG